MKNYLRLSAISFDLIFLVALWQLIFGNHSTTVMKISIVILLLISGTLMTYSHWLIHKFEE